jgi:hypothetical protein|tara:strand:+ start:6451 stop:6582 length:132 start_codon:yes stop_codon:yes gene_type:complete
VAPEEAQELFKAKLAAIVLIGGAEGADKELLRVVLRVACRRAV